MILYQDPTWRMTPSRDSRGVLIRDSVGLILFRLGLWVGGVEIAYFPVVSGQPAHQRLLTCDERPESDGSPLGEAEYDMGDSDAHDSFEINWAGGHGNYSKVYSGGLGPFWVGLHLRKGYNGLLDDAGIHCDWNEDEGAPGTLACVGIQGEESARDLDRAQEFVELQERYHARVLVVDHGLGTVPKPQPKKVQPVSGHVYKGFGKPDLGRLLLDGKDTTGEIVLKFPGKGAWSCAIDGKPVKAKSLELRLDV